MSTSLQRSQTYSFKSMRAAALGLIALLVVAMGYSIWKLRSDAIEDAFKDTGNLATVLASQVGEAVRSVDDIIGEIQNQVLQQDIASEDALRRLMSTEFGHIFLKSKAERVPLAEVVTLIDLQGEAFATSAQWPHRKLNLSDRDYFHAVKESSGRGLYVSFPAERRFVGTPTVFFSKAIRSYTGEIIGIASIGSPISGLRNIYSSVKLLGNWSFTLNRTDGTVLARFPEEHFKLGTQMPKGSLWYEAAKTDGHFRSSGISVPEVRLVSARKVPEYPLIVAMGVGQEQALTVWRERAAIIAAGTVVATLCSMILLAGISAHVKLLKASELSLAEQKEQLAAKSAELEMTKAQAEAAVDHIAQGITMFDADQRLVLCNKRYLDIYHLTPEVVRPGVTFHEIFEYRKSLGNHIANHRRIPSSSIAHVLDGKRLERIVHLADDRVISIVSNPMPTGGWVTTHEDITERHQAAEKIAHMALHDSLTGLPDRAAFDQRIEEAMADLDVRDAPFAVLLFDLDFFKGVNDTLGHHAGDELLKYVAARVKSCMEPNDMLARFGGDEFICLLPCPGDAEQRSREMANKIFDVVEAQFALSGERISVGISMGIAMAPRDGSDVDTLLKNADLALYRAKEQGRNRFRFFSAADSNRTQAARNRRAG